MKIGELILLLIDLPEDNDIRLCVSGDYHKITGTHTWGKTTLLDVEGSIMAIEPEKWEFYKKEYKGATLVDKVQTKNK